MENKCAIADKQFLKQLHSNQKKEEKKKITHEKHVISLVILVTGLKIRRNLSY